MAETEEKSAFGLILAEKLQKLKSELFATFCCKMCGGGVYTANMVNFFPLWEIEGQDGLRGHYLHGEWNLSGDRIFQVRKERKLFQTKLAELMQARGVEVERMTISSIENKTRAVTDYELVVLSDIFRVSIAWFVGRE